MTRPARQRATLLAGPRHVVGLLRGAGGGDDVAVTLQPTRRSRRRRRGLLAAPIVVAVLVAILPVPLLTYAIGGTIALLLLAWGIKRPGKALIALMIFLPLQVVGLGLLLRLGAPASLLRPMGGLKELLGISILFAAIHHMRKTGEHLDGIDKALLAYVGVVTIYLLVPGLFSHTVSHQFHVRLLSWRADCGYVLLFFAVRHAPLPPKIKDRFGKVIIAIGVITILGGAWQFLTPSGFSNFMLHTVRVGDYQQRVLGNDPVTTSTNLAYLTNLHPLRVSSIFISPFDMSDYMLVVFAIVIERISRGQRGVSAFVVLAGAAFLLFASRVRADALAAGIILLIALAPGPLRPTTARLKLLLALMIGALAIIPSLGGTRFVGSQGGAASTTSHYSEFSYGVQIITDHPLGLGIGDVPGSGQRFDLVTLFGVQNGSFTTDNGVLQVGDELGLQAMIPWLILVVALLVSLGRRSRRSHPLDRAAWLSLIAILVAAQYHHVFLTYPVPWALWAALGLGMRPDRPDSADDPRRAAHVGYVPFVRASAPQPV